MTENRINNTNDETISSLIKVIPTCGLTDFSIFDQIKDALFDSPPGDFDKFSKLVSTELIKVLFNLYTNANSQKSQDTYQLSQFRSKIFNLLSFTGFKIQHSATINEKTSYVFKQMVLGGITDFNSFVRFLRNSLEYPDPEVDKFFSYNVVDFFPGSCSKVISSLSHITTISMLELMSLHSLIPILNICLKYSEKITGDYCSVIKAMDSAISTNFPENIGLAHQSSFLYLMSKSCFTLLGSGIIKFYKDINIQKVCMTIVEIIRYCPPSFNTILDEISHNMLTILTTETDKIESFSTILFFLLDFSNYTNESFTNYFGFISGLVEKLSKANKFNSSYFTVFCTYVCGILHAEVLPLSQRNGRFYSMLTYIKIPSENPNVRISHLEILFYSVRLQVSDFEYLLKKLSSSVSNTLPSGIFAVLREHLSILEYFSRSVKYLEVLLKSSTSTDQIKSRPFYYSFDFSLSLLGTESIKVLFTQMLMLLFINRSIINIESEWFHFYTPSSSFKDNMKQILMFYKQHRICEQIGKQHISNAHSIINCFSHFPESMIDNIWYSFYVEYFDNNQDVPFDTSVFRSTLIDTSSVFISFLRNLYTFLLERLPHGVKSIRIVQICIVLFEKLTNLQINFKDSDFQTKLTTISLKFLSSLPQFINNSGSSPNIPGIVLSLSKLIDHVVKSESFSLALLKGNTLSETLNSIQISQSNGLEISSFISFFAKKDIGFIKSQIVISSLFKCLEYDENNVLPLLKASFKNDPVQFFSQPLIHHFYKVIASKLDNAKPNIRNIILKFFHRIPKNALLPSITTPDIFENQKTISFLKGDYEISFPLDSFFMGLFTAMKTSPKNIDLWEIYINCTKELINHEYSAPEWLSLQYRLICGFLKSSERFPNIENVLIRLIDLVYSEKYPEFAGCLLSAIISYTNPPQINLVSLILSKFTSALHFKDFLNSITQIHNMKLLQSPVILEKIALLIMSHVPKESIDPVSFCLYVHFIIISSSFPVWKEKQQCDEKMNFIELNFLPESIQTLVLFAKGLLSENNSNISQLLNTSRAASQFLSNITIAELLSNCEPTQEVSDFLNDVISDSSLQHEFSFYRVIGPLLRSFPTLFPKFQTRIRKHIDKSMKDLQSLSTKLQGTFLVIMVPILDLSSYHVSDFSSVIQIALSFFKHQTSYLKCQAQLVIKKFYEKGDSEIRSEIHKYLLQSMKDANFPLPDHISKDFINLNWLSIQQTQFSCLYIMTDHYVDVIINYLERLPDSLKLANIQRNNPSEFIDYLVSLFEVMSSGLVSGNIIKRKLYPLVGKHVLSVIYTLQVLPRFRVLSPLSKFFSSSPTGFCEMFIDSIETGNCFETFFVLINDSILFNILEEYINNHISIITDKITISSKPEPKHYLIASFLTNFNSISNYKPLVDIMFKLYSSHILTFKTQFVNFNTSVFYLFSKYFAKELPLKFLQSCIVSCEIGNPLLIKHCILIMRNHFDYNYLNANNICGIPISQNYKVVCRFHSSIVISILENRGDLVQHFINNLVQKQEVYSLVYFLNTLIEKSIEFNKADYPPLDLYKECKNDDSRVMVLTYWMNSKIDDDFCTLFQILFSFLGIHLDSRIRNILEGLEIPQSADIIIVSHLILEAMSFYSRNNQVISLILSLISRNKERFQSPIKVFMPHIQDHLIYINSLHKKNFLFQAVQAFVYITELLDEPTKLSAVGSHLVRTGFKIVKQLNEQPEQFQKIRSGFIKSVSKLAKLFPAHAEFASELITILQNISEKIKNSTQPTTGIFEIGLFRENIFEGLPDLIDAISNTGSNHYNDSITDYLISVVMSKDEINWPNALIALYNLCNSTWKDKIRDKINTLLHHDHLHRSFPLFWEIYETNSNRMVTLIPFALGLSQNNKKEEVAKAPLVETAVLSLLNSPTDYSMEILSNYLHQCCSGVFDESVLNSSMRVLKLSISSDISPIVKERFLSFLNTPMVSKQFFSHYIGLINENNLALLPDTSIFIFASSRINYLFPSAITKVFQFTTQSIIEESQYINNNSIPLSILLSSFYDGSISPSSFLQLIVNVSSEINNQFDLTNFDEILEHQGDRSIQIRVGVKTIQYLCKHLRERSINNLDQYPDLEDSLKPKISEPILLFKHGMIQRSMKSLVESNDHISHTIGRDILSHLDFGDLGVITCVSGESVSEANRAAFVESISRSSEFVTSHNLLEYILVYEIKRYIVGSQKKSSKKGPFYIKLGSVLPPSLHVFYKKLRDTAIQVLSIEGINQSIKDHDKRFSRSLLYHNEFYQHRPSFSSLTHDASTISQNLNSIIVALSAQQPSNSTLKALEQAILLCSKQKPNSDIVLSVLFRFFKHMDSFALKIISNSGFVPFQWSNFVLSLSQKHDSLKALQQKIHPGFYISLLQMGVEVPIDFINHSSLFVSVLDEIMGSEFASNLKKARSLTEKCVAVYRGTKSSFSKDFQSRCHKILDYLKSGANGPGETFHLSSFHPPLEERNTVTTHSVSFFSSDPMKTEISFFIVLNSGERTYYTISPYQTLNLRLSLMNHLFSSLLKKSPGSNSRGQLLNPVHSIDIGNDFYLSKTTSHPLHNLTAFEKLVESKINTQLIHEVKHFPNHILASADFCQWFSILGSRYAALSILQIITNSIMPNPLDIRIDEKNCSIIVSKFEKGDKNNVVPRLHGAIGQFIDQCVLNGPFRHGLISAADAVSLHSQRIKLYLSSILDVSFDETIEAESVAQIYSLRTSGSDAVQKSIDNLINSSQQLSTHFCVPWL